MLNFLLRYLELVFTAAGLLVIFGVTALVHPEGIDTSTVAAVTAILVGVIHGVLFWAVRHRQRLARQHAFVDARRMLRDVVMNQLAVIRINVELQAGRHPQESAAAVARFEKAIDVIDQTLEELSEESLSRWRSHYNLSAAPFSK
jgi:divalent metal cation (Fe/Co/Zn/Cd) transporter